MAFKKTIFGKRKELFKKCIAAYKLSDGNDSHTNGLNGTVGTAVTFSNANAVNGNAAQFVNNGANSRITLPLTGNLFSFTTGTVDKPFSMKCNIIRTASGVNQDIFSKYSVLSNSSEYRIYIESTSNRIAVALCNKNSGGAIIQVRTNAVFPINTMTNLIVNYNGNGAANGIEIFWNNVLQDVTDLSGGTYTGMGITTLPAVIGNKAASNPDPLRGAIDELYIFNDVLSTDERSILQTNYYPNF